MIAESICLRPLRSGRQNGVAWLRPGLFQCQRPHAGSHPSWQEQHRAPPPNPPTNPTACSEIKLGPAGGPCLGTLKAGLWARKVITRGRCPSTSLQKVAGPCHRLALRELDSLLLHSTHTLPVFLTLRPRSSAGGNTVTGEVASDPGLCRTPHRSSLFYRECSSNVPPRSLDWVRAGAAKFRGPQPLSDAHCPPRPQWHPLALSPRPCPRARILPHGGCGQLNRPPLWPGRLG